MNTLSCNEVLRMKASVAKPVPKAENSRRVRTTSILILTVSLKSDIGPEEAIPPMNN